MARTGAESAQLTAKLRDIPTLAAEFTAAHPASIAEGFEYGRLFNRSWLGAALAEE